MRGRSFVVVERLTPELVLVDPELAARARAELADPPDCLEARPVVEEPPPVVPRALPVVPRALPVGAERLDSRRPPRTVGRHLRPLDDPSPAPPLPAPEPVVVAQGSEPGRRRPHLARLARGGTWAVVALFLLSPLLAFLPASSSQLPRLAAPASLAAGPTAEPAPSASEPRRSAASPPLSAAKRVTISWPASPGAIVYNVIFVDGDNRVDAWTRGTSLSLEIVDGARAVDYQWFAYPGFRDGETVRYGSPAGHGEVSVSRASIPRTTPPTGGQGL